MATPPSVVPLAGCREPGTIDASLRPAAGHDRCVIHPNECPYKFVNPLDTDAAIDHPSCNSVSSVPIGHCGTGEDKTCALTAKACRDPGSFVRPDASVPAECTVLRDRTRRGTRGDGLTRYVGCRGGNLDPAWDSVVCVTSLPECRELAGNDGSATTVSPSDPSCTCSETRTGACLSMGDVLGGADSLRYFCAVSPELCDRDAGFSYHSVRELMRFSGIDCRVCDAGAVEEHSVTASEHSTGASWGTIRGMSAAGSLGGMALLVALLGLLGSRLWTRIKRHREGRAKHELVEIQNRNSITNDGKAVDNGPDLEEELEEVDERVVQVLKATYT